VQKKYRLSAPHLAALPELPMLGSGLLHPAEKYSSTNCLKFLHPEKTPFSESVPCQSGSGQIPGQYVKRARIKERTVLAANRSYPDAPKNKKPREWPGFLHL
jgi:hypothetical protein